MKISGNLPSRTVISDYGMLPLVSCCKHFLRYSCSFYSTLMSSTRQDAEISCLCPFPPLPSHLLFGDGESKLSLLDLSQGSTIHLMPNTLVCLRLLSFPDALLPQVGTGRYRRGSKYHDKSVDTIHCSDNGYIVTASTGSKYDHLTCSCRHCL